MAIRNVPNEVALKGVMLATETVPGQLQTPTHRLLMDFSATPGIGTLRRSEDATGGFDRTATPRRQAADPSGTIGGDLTYEELAILMQYAVKGAVAGVSDAEDTPGYLYTFSPTFNADDIETASVMFGVEGLPWQATGVRLDEFTITADATDANDAWAFSGTPFMSNVDRVEGIEFVATGGTTTTAIDADATWTPDELIGQYIFKDYGTHIGDVRIISDNDATTITVETAFGEAVTAGDVLYISAAFPTIATPDYETITLEGTKVYLDAYNASSSTIGTTDVSERVLSFNVTQSLSLARKRRMPGNIGRIGRGAREISGTVRFEFDRWDEYVAWRDAEELSIRIEKEGSVIDADAGTTKLARIDVERAVFDSWTEDADNNNMTASLAFLALLPASEPILTISAKNTLATLP